MDAGLAEHGGVEVAADAAMVEGHEQHVGEAAAGEAGAVLDAAVGMARVDVGGLELGAQLELDAGERMVEDEIADRQLLDHRDAHGAQMPGPPDARAHQDRRRVEGAGRQHDQGRAQLAPAVAGAGAHADRPAAVEQDLVDQGVAANLQIRPAARRLEITVAGRDAHAVTAVDGVAADPFGFGRVEVVRPGIAEPEGRVLEGAVDRAPAFQRGAVDRDRPAATVIGLVAIGQVVLETVEERQHVAARPALAAHLRPLVESVEHAADGDLAVDRGAAADPAATPQQARRLALGARRQQRRPHVVAWKCLGRMTLKGFGLRIASGVSAER